MSGEIVINTKYARRDIKRINSAIDSLEAVKKDYQNVAGLIGSAYKGNASKYLQEQLCGVKVKNINSTISKLKTARDQLNYTIKKAEAANESIKSAIK